MHLYNQLLSLKYSPVAALNRTFAFSKVYGKEKAVAKAEKLNLVENHFYFTLLGELYRGIDNDKAKMHLQKALSLAKNSSDKKIILNKINEL